MIHTRHFKVSVASPVFLMIYEPHVVKKWWNNKVIEIHFICNSVFNVSALLWKQVDQLGFKIHLLMNQKRGKLIFSSTKPQSGTLQLPSGSNASIRRGEPLLNFHQDGPALSIHLHKIAQDWNKPHQAYSDTDQYSPAPTTVAESQPEHPKADDEWPLHWNVLGHQVERLAITGWAALAELKRRS